MYELKTICSVSQGLSEIGLNMFLELPMFQA